MNEKYVDGGVCGVVRMMVIRLFTCDGKYKDNDLRCVCGDVESEEHLIGSK